MAAPESPRVLAVIEGPRGPVRILEPEPSTPEEQEYFRRQFIKAMVDMAIGAEAPQAKEEAGT